MAATVGRFSGQLVVDLGAIQQNWTGLDRIAHTALTGAVVKADAYGCGLLPVADALWSAGARFFFVATPDEAFLLRQKLPDAHIFVLNGLPPNAAKDIAAANLMPVINSLSELDQWLGFCVSQGEALPAAIQFDTGMNRLGIRMQDASVVKSLLERAGGYQPQLIMSHLACADIVAHEKNRTQRALFQSLLGQFPDIPASLANSAGMLMGRENHFQIVRPGISLFGGRAVAGRPNPMSGVLKLEMPVLQVSEAKLGETVGYGATYTLTRDSRLATVAHGYADGYLRAASSANGKSGVHMFIKGRLLPVLGRISMDLSIVDVTDLGAQPPVPGEMVEVIGPNVSVDDIADAAGTIGYEILTSLSGRYQRIYRGADGQMFEG